MIHFICVAWLILFVWHDSLYLCDMTHCICVTWLISYVGHDSFYLCDMTHFYLSDMTHLHAWRDSRVWHDSFHMSDMAHSTCMGWLRLVGSLKCYVSFAKEPYKRDDILQKWVTSHKNASFHSMSYGVATISRLLKMIGLFCRISSLL
jgi:hypothetical protein